MDKVHSSSSFFLSIFSCSPSTILFNSSCKKQRSTMIICMLLISNEIISILQKIMPTTYFPSQGSCQSLASFITVSKPSHVSGFSRRKIHTLAESHSSHKVIGLSSFFPVDQQPWDMTSYSANMFFFKLLIFYLKKFLHTCPQEMQKVELPMMCPRRSTSHTHQSLYPCT